jgi:hypothetical protein
MENAGRGKSAQRLWSWGERSLVTVKGANKRRISQELKEDTGETTFRPATTQALSLLERDERRRGYANAGRGKQCWKLATGRIALELWLNMNWGCGVKGVCSGGELLAGWDRQFRTRGQAKFWSRWLLLLEMGIAKSAVVRLCGARGGPKRAILPPILRAPSGCFFCAAKLTGGGITRIALNAGIRVPAFSRTVCMYAVCVLYRVPGRVCACAVECRYPVQADTRSAALCKPRGWLLAERAHQIPRPTTRSLFPFPLSTADRQSQIIASSNGSNSAGDSDGAVSRSLPTRRPSSKTIITRAHSCGFP